MYENFVARIQKIFDYYNTLVFNNVMYYLGTFIQTRRARIYGSDACSV